MANEITLVGGLSASKGGAVLAPNTLTVQADMTGEDMAFITQTATTSDAALDIGSVATGSFYWLKVYNRDSTNYVELSTDTGGNFDANVILRIPPGAFAGPILVTGVKYIEADTASCDCSVYAVEV
jgi:hypothetical protein